MWVMVKSTSLWFGSEIQVEVCANANGAASARMPVRTVNRFMRGNSFRCRTVTAVVWVGVEATRGCPNGNAGECRKFLITHLVPRPRSFVVSQVSRSRSPPHGPKPVRGGPGPGAPKFMGHDTKSPSHGTRMRQARKLVATIIFRMDLRSGAALWPRASAMLRRMSLPGQFEKLSGAQRHVFLAAFWAGRSTVWIFFYSSFA